MRSGDIVAIVGGGGKTSSMFSIARQLAQRDKAIRILCTTTTKMLEPSVGDCSALILADQHSEAVKAMDDLFGTGTQVAMLAKGFLPHPGPKRKVAGIPPDWPQQFLNQNICDVVLVEADGSRHLPFKAPDHSRQEPVLPKGTAVVICVVGLDALGCVLCEDNVCRAKIVSKVSGIDVGGRVTAECIGKILGKVDLWVHDSAAIRTFVAMINKVDTSKLFSEQAAAIVATVRKEIEQKQRDERDENKRGHAQIMDTKVICVSVQERRLWTGHAET